MPDDPFRVLGVGPDASLEELTTARRRLALSLHPDVGGDEAAMQAVNRAFDAAVELVITRRPVTPPPSGPSQPPSPPPATARRERWLRGVQHDAPSFTIDVLPVEAFEALLV
ncbi:MAG: hypothetical protein RJA49_2030, partial [Actinomycetota bacterium]